MKVLPGKHESTSMEAVTATMEDYLKVIFDLNKTRRGKRTYKSGCL